MTITAVDRSAGDVMSSNEEKKHFLIEAQAGECARVLSMALSAVLLNKQALDHFLNSLFRNTPKYGSKDRRRIGDAVFRVFRDYGFLQHLLPEEKRNAENLLLYSSVLAGEKLFPAIWQKMCDVPEEELLEAAAKEELSARMRCLGKNLSMTENIPSELQVYFPSKETAEDVAASLLERSPVWFRSNFPGDGKKTARIVREFDMSGVKILFHPFKKDAFRLENDKRVQLQNFSAFRDGLFEIQDLSSQCIGGTLLALPVPENASILDYCAGGGGKSLQIASGIRKQKGKVCSWDIRSHKLEELRKRAGKARLDNIRILDSIPEQKVFDAVLLDVPCSGSGRWRRAPEQRLLLTEEEITSLVQTQREILENAAHMVKNGGTLVYGTCSCFYCENEGNIRYFLDRHPEFILEEYPSPLTGENVPGMLSILPSHGNCDGAFAARLRKKG